MVTSAYPIMTTSSDICSSIGNQFAVKLFPPEHEPCRTPHVNSQFLENLSFVDTFINLGVRYDWYPCRDVSFILNLFSTTLNCNWWSTVLNAAERSESTTDIKFWFSIDHRISFTNFTGNTSQAKSYESIPLTGQCYSSPWFDNAV